MSSRIRLERIESACKKIDPVFLHTPQFICEPLSDLLGVRLILKVETLNPIRCFKGRGADWLISQADLSVPIVCASAGNFGQAMAYGCRKRGIPITIFASKFANTLKIERMKSLGAEIILEGEDFDAAKEEARQFATKKKFRFVEDGNDVETAEGAGTIGLELVSFAEKIDALLIPLGNGALFNGVATVFKHKSAGTKMTAVQASGAPAMIESWQQKRTISNPHVHTIADGIAVRLPIEAALNDMKDLTDDALLVSEESILKAIQLLHQHAGLVVEPSGAVGVAAILENREFFNGKTVATILCGGNMTEKQMKEWL
jgi:threonine dehydratase